MGVGRWGHLCRASGSGENQRGSWTFVLGVTVSSLLLHSTTPGQARFWASLLPPTALCSPLAPVSSQYPSRLYGWGFFLPYSLQKYLSHSSCYRKPLWRYKGEEQSGSRQHRSILTCTQQKHIHPPTRPQEHCEPCAHHLPLAQHQSLWAWWNSLSLPSVGKAPTSPTSICWRWSSSWMLSFSILVRSVCVHGVTTSPRQADSTRKVSKTWTRIFMACFDWTSSARSLWVVSWSITVCAFLEEAPQFITVKLLNQKEKLIFPL